VVLLASHGIRYTAHPLWAAMKGEAAEALPKPPNTSPDADLCLWKSEEHHE
jgi:cysteine synthase A